VLQTKSKECARLQSEVGQLEEEAETLREGEKERERLLKAKSRECARLESEILRMQDEMDALREKQRDFDREADMAAELLLQYEASTNLSATALVKEALAHREGASLSATALVRDALSHHVKEGGDAGPRKTASLDLLRESIRSIRESPARDSSSKSAATSPVPPRTVSFANGVEKAGGTASDGVRADGKPCARQSAAADELCRDNDQLQKQLEAMKRKVSDVQAELDAAVRERQELLSRIRSIEQAADRDIDTNLRISISEANRRVAEVHAQLASATAERDEARRVTQDLKSMVGDVLQRQSHDTQQQQAQFAAENQRIKKEADEVACSLRHEVEALRHRMEALQAENNALLRWRESGEKNREHEQAEKISEAQKEAEELRQANSSLRVERTNLLKENQALLLRSERLALERENANAEIERLKGKVDELEAKHAAAREQLTSHCNRFDGMLLQARKAWQCQLDEAEQRQHQGRRSSPREYDVERVELEQNIQRLRECNRLLILELEDTRERLLEERRRRHAAECTAVSAAAAAQVAAGAAAAAAAGCGRSGEGEDVAPATGTNRSSSRTGIQLLPPVEDTPAKVAPTVSGNVASEYTSTGDQLQDLINGCGGSDSIRGYENQVSASLEHQEQDFRHAQRGDPRRNEHLSHDGEAQGKVGAEDVRGQQRGDDMFASPHPMLPLRGQVARATAPHPVCARSRSQTRSPSPEPQWSEPAGLMASNVKHTGGDASIMNLSRAAVRQLSCAPEEVQMSPQPRPDAACSRAAQDSSVIGMSRSAMREVSVPREEHPPRPVYADAPVHSDADRRREQHMHIGMRQTSKVMSKGAQQSASRPRSERKPLSTMTRSDINAHMTAHALRGV